MNRHLRTIREFITLLLFISFSSFSSGKLPAIVPAIQKVAVIGAGVAGLATAACLKQLSTCENMEVMVFESRDSFLQAKLGGGLQLSGGSVVLNRIGCYPALDEVAERLTKVVSRNNKGDELVRLDLDRLIRNGPADVRDVLCSDEGTPMVYSIMRDALLSILYKATLKKNAQQDNACKVAIKTKKRATLVVEDESTHKVSVSFADGSTEGGFDLVVGADGVSSTVKAFTAFGDQTILSFFDPGREAARETTRQGESGAKRPTDDSRYTGIRISYCVPPADKAGTSEALTRLRSSDRGTFNQWLGDGCYALAASYGGLEGVQHMLAVVYRDGANAEHGQNANWASSSPAQQRDALQGRLKAAGFEGNAEIQSLLAASAMEGGRFFDLGVKDSTVPLRRWSSASGRVLLLGDSAHAMAPFLGQGANQALQDAYCLAGLVIRHNKACQSASIPPDVKQISSEFENIRKIPTALLSVKSRFLGLVETLGGSAGMRFKNNFFRVLGAIGVVKKEYLEGAMPKMDPIELK